MPPRKKKIIEPEAIEAEIVEDDLTPEAVKAERQRQRHERHALAEGAAFGGDPPPRDIGRAELTKRVGLDGELSGMDARLLELAAARRSPEEMGEDLGIAPARAAQRVREILASRDWLSNLEQEILLMQEMIQLKNQVQDLVKRYADADYMQAMDPRWATTLQKILTDLMTVVDNRSKRVAEARVTIRAAHAELIVAAIDKAFTLTMYNLREHGVVIEESVGRDALEDSLPKAFAMIEARTETV